MTTETSEPMSLVSTVILQVMERGHLSQKDVAAACDINPGHFSRMLSGELALPAKVLPKLYGMTGDKALITLITGEHFDAIIVPVLADPVERAIEILASIRRRTRCGGAGGDTCAPHPGAPRLNAVA